MKHKDVYTSGDVARICRVAPRTVAQWADSGLLKCYRLPTPGRDRRFRRRNVLDFIRKSELDVDLPDELRTREVLLVGLSGSLREQVNPLLTKLFQESNGSTTRMVYDLFNAGLVTGKVWPNIVVLDCCLGRQAVIDAAEHLRLCDDKQRPVLICLASEDESNMTQLLAHFDGVLKHPVTTGQLCDLIEEKSGHLLDT